MPANFSEAEEMGRPGSVPGSLTDPPCPPQACSSQHTPGLGPSPSSLFPATFHARLLHKDTEAQKGSALAQSHTARGGRPRTWTTHEPAVCAPLGSFCLAPAIFTFSWKLPQDIPYFQSSVRRGQRHLRGLQSLCSCCPLSWLSVAISPKPKKGEKLGRAMYRQKRLPARQPSTPPTLCLLEGVWLLLGLQKLGTCDQ